MTVSRYSRSLVQTFFTKASFEKATQHRLGIHAECDGLFLDRLAVQGKLFFLALVLSLLGSRLFGLLFLLCKLRI